MGGTASGRKEIINLTFPILRHATETCFVPGLYQIPFQIQLPDWLPNSMMCGELHAYMLMQVKYRLMV